VKFRVTVHSHCTRIDWNDIGRSRNRGHGGYFSIAH